MSWMLAAVIIIMFMKLRHYWPVQGLTYITCDEMQAMRNGVPSIKWIDIRDSSEYWQEHLPDSVNIYVGRLPYVWHQDIEPGERIALIGSNKRSIQKAARILKRKGGMSSMQAWVIPKRKQTIRWANDDCTCMK
ncbi:rhodanese-like domain-containing protein [Paenibacillus marinisediminis]